MKKGLLGSTALVAATALTVGAAQAAEAPTWKLSGNMNFQFYYADRDSFTAVAFGTTTGTLGAPVFNTTETVPTNDLYFGVDEAELQLNVSGTTDGGLDYGFKIELNANTSDSLAADEARISLGGSWGTVHLGDEDGVEDIMSFGGETILGATGGWDGDGDDVTLVAGLVYPTIVGDTSDDTKITYYSPRFSGFQLGASWTPTDAGGDRTPFDDSEFQNSLSFAANYDNTFGGSTRLRLSGVYTMASYEGRLQAVEDIGAYSLGGILGFGGFSIGANWTDNSDSGTDPTADEDWSYWNVAAGWESGPFYLSAGYIAHTYSTGPVDFEPAAWSLTADYTVAPGLNTYIEWTGYDADTANADANVFIIGAAVSF